MNWIRNVPSVLVTHDPWHAVLSVTTSGLRLTACAEVFAPDDGAETAPPLDQPEIGARCQRCDETDRRTSPGLATE